MSKNSSLLQKADIALADLSSNGGLLLPDQANTFIRKLIVVPTIMRDVRVVSMNSPSRKINKIVFGSRIMRPAVSSTALSSGDRSKPTTEQIQLDTKELIAEVRLPYDVLEDNIESASAANNEATNTGPGGLRNTIITLIAERAATDLEAWALLGDTGSGDAYLAMQNGWLRRAALEGNVVDRSGAAITKETFKRGKQAMPKEYLAAQTSMRHYVSVDQYTEYLDTLADRPTALGDTLINGQGTVAPYGSPLSQVTQMADADGLFLNPKNLIFGIQRQISLEYGKLIAERVYQIVLTCRVCTQIEESDAVVRYTNLGAIS